MTLLTWFGEKSVVFVCVIVAWWCFGLWWVLFGFGFGFGWFGVWWMSGVFCYYVVGCFGVCLVFSG